MEIALQQWKPASYNEPDIKSITSRLVNHEMCKTNLILVKHQFVKHLPFLRHFFIQIGENIWHPGQAGADVYFERISYHDLDATTVNTLELCDYCTYYYFKDKFINDAKFFLLTRNCEIIIGHFEETFLCYILLSLLVYSSLFGIGVITLVIILGILLFFMIVPIQSGVIYKTCPHIDLNCMVVNPAKGVPK